MMPKMPKGQYDYDLVVGDNPVLECMGLAVFRQEAGDLVTIMCLVVLGQLSLQLVDYSCDDIAQFWQ
jgi:hypothetical protein